LTDIFTPISIPCIVIYEDVGIGKTISFILGVTYDAFALGYSYGFCQGLLKEGPFNMGRNEISPSYYF
jgi:hypothetical protein